MIRRFMLSFFLVQILGVSSLFSASSLSEPIIFTQIPDTPASRSNWEQGFSQAKLMVLEPGGKIRVLSEGFSAATDPEVSFDGGNVLFAGKKNPTDSWEIYEIGLDGSELRKITEQAGNTRHPIYQSTFYTIVSNEPWYQLTFVSDLAGELADARGTPAKALYSTRLDGSELRRLTFSPGRVADPVMMEDGRILFSAEQSSLLRLSPTGRMALFTVNTDGADLAAFSTDEGLPFKRMPALTTNRLCVFVESEEPTLDGSGTLGSVQLRRPLKSYRPVTTPAGRVFHSPAPAPGGKVLVSSRDSEGGAFELTLIDPATGSSETLYAVAGQHLIQGRIAAARTEPDGRSSVVNEGHPNGQFYGLNVSITDLDREQWESAAVKRLRVLEGIPYSEGTQPSSAAAVATMHRRLLGEVPIESDGSFFVEVPANIPVQLQLLDEDSMAIRSCSWIWVRNKEPRGCIGCHEDGELTPENRMVAAVEKPPFKLILNARQRRTIDFSRDIMPIVAEKCSTAACHGAGTHGPDLSRGNREAGEYAAAVYERLIEPVPAHESGLLGRYVNRGEARTSPLIWHLLGRNTSRPWDSSVDSSRQVFALESGILTDSERKAFIEWIDFGAHFEGLPPEEASTSDSIDARGNR
ncbi:MAG: hypothetical protein JSU96_21115 [Acidobacteriota bacterium]|nr:MAG: hypothetical protein JSU96_21115 [Acidobacteriota bacterium]